MNYSFGKVVKVWLNFGQFKVKAMNIEKKMVYEFDSFELDPTEHRLLHNGKPVALPPKSFETLIILVENNNRLVDKETLLNRIWADSFVEEGNLKTYIHTLRKVFGEAKFIETIPKKGYRFNAPVKLVEKKIDEFTIEKQTVSNITIEASKIDGSEPQSINAPDSIVYSFSQTKIYFAAVLLLILVLTGAFFLAKNPQDKNRAASANPLDGIKSIAVLPLKSLNVPPSDQELRLGTADSIVTKLSAVKQLAVRPTSATIQYLDKNYDAATVGRELDVDSILEGSVQKEEQKLKINLQLVSVADGKVVWADSFTNDLSDFLNGQDSVANRVSRLIALNSNMTVPENSLQNSTNLTAQELYLKGVFAMATSTRKIGNVIQARDFFEQAIRIDPNYAAAHARLANSYTTAAALNLLSPAESYPKAEQSARRALEIDPDSAAAHNELAEVETNYNWNWQAGEAEYRRALELNPNSVEAHGSYAEFLARMGRFQEAEYQGDLAHQLDPTGINIEAVKALGYCYAHRYDEAVAQSRMVIEKDPNAYLAYLYLAVAQDAKGNYAAALEAAQKASALTGGAPPDLFALGSTYALMRKETETNEILSKLELLSRQQYVDPFYFAAIYTLRGEKEKAFDYLEKCRAEKSYWITTLKVFPFLDGMRADSNFAKLLQQVNLAG
jgi:DNA-binding winged helix-turn-helix (wHTH) protein/TolB-like protein